MSERDLGVDRRGIIHQPGKRSWTGHVSGGSLVSGDHVQREWVATLWSGVVWKLLSNTTSGEFDHRQASNMRKRKREIISA